jgi:hypothetical protein
LRKIQIAKLLPVSDDTPLIAIPIRPNSYSQSYFAQPVLVAPS